MCVCGSSGKGTRRRPRVHPPPGYCRQRALLGGRSDVGASERGEREWCECDRRGTEDGFDGRDTTQK